VKPELPVACETVVDAKVKLEEWLDSCEEEEVVAAMAEQEARKNDKEEKQALEQEGIDSRRCKLCLLSLVIWQVATMSLWPAVMLFWK
jgi:hypothetical protein